MYSVSYKKSAAKGLLRLPSKVRVKMADTLKEIANDPYSFDGDWKRLSGSAYWRLRIGSYRAICDVLDEELLLLALKIGPRGDVYK